MNDGVVARSAGPAAPLRTAVGIECGNHAFGPAYQAGQHGGAHLAGMATAAHSSKLYDTLAQARRATNARNARSPRRTRGFWVAVTAEGGGFTVRWVGRPRSRPRGKAMLRSPR